MLRWVGVDGLGRVGVSVDHFLSHSATDQVTHDFIRLLEVSVFITLTHFRLDRAEVVHAVVNEFEQLAYSSQLDHKPGCFEAAHGEVLDDFEILLVVPPVLADFFLDQLAEEDLHEATSS